MCANYLPVGQSRLLRALFGVDLPLMTVRPDTYPMHEAPVIRSIIVRGVGALATRECIAARFGLLPRWARADTIEQRRHTYNARTETVDQLASYKGPWKARQFCLIPVEAFYEPCYESGKAVRWRVALKSGLPFALAGIWERWRAGDQVIESFSMLTVNADHHELMRRMHAPGEEKRMPVIIRPTDYDHWLNATPEQARALCVAYPAADMVAAPAPRPTKTAAPGASEPRNE
jgi:putative SOS response-associated peptidase YedK